MLSWLSLLPSGLCCVFPPGVQGKTLMKTLPRSSARTHTPAQVPHICNRSPVSYTATTSTAQISHLTSGPPTRGLRQPSPGAEWCCILRWRHKNPWGSLLCSSIQASPLSPSKVSANIHNRTYNQTMPLVSQPPLPTDMMLLWQTRISSRQDLTAYRKIGAPPRTEQKALGFQGQFLLRAIQESVPHTPSPLPHPSSLGC